jgi:hypothetical protein
MKAVKRWRSRAMFGVFDLSFQVVVLFYYTSKTNCMHHCLTPLCTAYLVRVISISN